MSAGPRPDERGAAGDEPGRPIVVPSVAARRLLASALAASAFGLAGRARAEGGYVAFGPTFSPTYAARAGASGYGLGGELSWSHYAKRCCWDSGHGAFLQAQRYGGDAPSMRYAAGYQFPGFVGWEAGLAVRTGERGTSPALHGAVFGSIGLGHLALRVSPASGPYGSEVALVVAVKLPVPYGSPPPNLNFGQGRPFDVAGSPRVAGVAPGGDWA